MCLLASPNGVLMMLKKTFKKLHTHFAIPLHSGLNWHGFGRKGAALCQQGHSDKVSYFLQPARQNKQVQCDGVLLLSSALMAIKYLLSTNIESMRMSIYVNHFSNFYFPDMGLKSFKVHYPDLLVLILLESKYKTVFKTSPTKRALEVLFIAFATCKRARSHPSDFGLSFRGKWYPEHPKTG